MTEPSDWHQRIANAFAQVRRPQRAELVRGTSLEASQVRNYLAPRTWQQLDRVALVNYDSRADLSALPAFLSDEGFRYYLPALLEFILSDFDKAGLLVDSVIAALGRCQPLDYSAEERKLIVEFMSQLLADHAGDELMCAELRRVRHAWDGVSRA